MILRFGTIFLLLICAAESRAQSYHPGPEPGDSLELQELFERGQVEARRDVEARSYKIKFFSLPQQWHGQYVELVRDSLGVEIDFGPDVVLAREDAYWTGYNGIVAREIERRYGAGILDSLYSEAYRRYARVRPGTIPLNPEVIQNVPLTEQAREAGITGFVAVQFDIAPTGEPVNLKVVRSRGFGLDELALAAVQQLRFAPAEDQENGVPGISWTAPVRFKSE